jgi:ABC-2 type transport system ATP-binding protein
MGQRLMIARALMHAPDVLFLDEPTNNLDPQSRLFLWDRIRELNQQGLTILLTTHDMDEADRLCERIAIMDHGKILVNNTSAELKKMIPGGNSLELHLRLPDNDAVGVRARLLEALHALPGVSKVDEVDATPEPGAMAQAAVAAAIPGPWGGMASMQPAAPAAQEPGMMTFRIYAEAAGSLVGPAAQAVLGSGAEVRDLHVKRPSLEDVFIYLTGRHLR